MAWMFSITTLAYFIISNEDEKFLCAIKWMGELVIRSRKEVYKLYLLRFQDLKYNA